MERQDDITSEELDVLLDSAETVDVPHTGKPTEVRLYVAVDAETLQELEQKAAAQHTDLNAVAARALRAGAHAA